MRITYLKKLQISKFESYLLGLIILLFICRSSIPFFKYPFILLYIVYVTLVLKKYYSNLIIDTRNILFNYSIILILFLLLVISLFSSHKIHLLVFKDITNAIVLLTFLYFLQVHVNTRIRLQQFVYYLINLIILLASIISFTGVLKYFNNTIFNYDFSFLNFTKGIKSDNLEIDYNFAILPVFFGFISVISILKDSQRKYKKIALNLLLLVFTMQILLSGSRRGIILLLLMIAGVISLSLFSNFYKRIFFFRSILKNCYLYLCIITFVPIIILLFFTNSSYEGKNEALRLFGTDPVYKIREKITGTVYRYIVAVNKNVSYSKLNNWIWKPGLDPKNPDSGWGKRNYKLTFPLKGKNVAIVPDDSKGYLIDSTWDCSSFENNAYFLSEIASFKINRRSIVEGSVYCYVSESFNGDDVRLSCEGNTYGNIFGNYDLKNKGTWQKLFVSSPCNVGEAILNLYFTKQNASDFKSLNGYVIFAYPQANVIQKDYIFDPKDPSSGWAYRIHKIEYPLSGKNVELIPVGTKGYKMDSTCNSYYDKSHNVSSSFTQVFDLKVANSEKYRVSVYCFVSDEFNGEEVSIGTGWEAFQNKIVSGKIVSYYDLQTKGIWKKLEIEFDCSKGNVPIYLNFSQKGARNFSKLKGCVIFAYPSFSLVKDQKEIGLNNHFMIDHSYVRQYNINSAGILNFSETLNADPFRFFVFKLVSEDTTYYGLKSDVFYDSPIKVFSDQRILRWEFAIKIFSKEYNLKQKIFGGGFNFLNWYGYYFLNDKTASDYPHNPLLHILLYSGVLGLLIYCFFLYKVFFYYIKYIKEYPLLFIFFLITFFFSFFSGGSPFDPPIMGFFSILPFFIHSVHKREESELKKKITEN